MKRNGVFFFVVGPSGAGKDTLIDGAKALLAPTGRYVFAQRVITRPAGSPGEDHASVTEAEFAASEQAGAFLVTWDAHGLRYGLPSELADALAAGRNVVANGSRAVVGKLMDLVPRLVVVEVTAPAHVLAQRIALRGREAGDGIAARLARRVNPFPAGVQVARVPNAPRPDPG